MEPMPLKYEESDGSQSTLDFGSQPNSQGAADHNMIEEALCRVCANTSKGVDMLLRENATIREMTKRYLGLELVYGLPTHICLSCCTLLKTWDAFMVVFSTSQKHFKLQLDLMVPPSTNSAVTPVLAKSPTTPVVLPKKRKLETLDAAAAPLILLSPSTSASSVQASPEPGKTQTDGVHHASDTDDASECPAEVVQERSSKMKRPSSRSKGRPRKLQTVQPVAINNLQPANFQQAPMVQPLPPMMPFGYPFQPPTRYMGLPANYLDQFQQMPLRAALTPPPAHVIQQQFGLRPPMVPTGQTDEGLVLQNFLANLPPLLHQSFLHHYIQNLMMMNADKRLQQPFEAAKQPEQPTYQTNYQQ